MANGNFGGGDGTELNPYLVEDALDLDAVRNNLSVHYKQVATIDLSGWGNWQPIGKRSGHHSTADREIFSGSYDGDNFEIHNLSSLYDTSGNGTGSGPGIGYTAYDIGLFGHANTASFKNIHLINVQTRGSQNVGGLMGWDQNSSFENCSSEGSVLASVNVGGLIGNASNSNINSTIKNCFSAGTVSNPHSNANYHGGFIGTGYGIFISDCYASTAVAGVYTAGGLTGELRESTISKCFSLGNVETGEWGGGAGGFIGSSRDNAIANCYSRGNVITGSGAYESGGFIGYSRTDNISNCYSTGFVPATSSWGDINGFMGAMYLTSTTINNCYYDTNTSGKSDTGKGEPRTTLQMTDPYDEITTYLTWDFETIWGISATKNDGYPFLLWTLQDILVFVRNNPTLFPDAQPYQDGALIMIPMRYPIIQMGGNIHWDEINFIATVKMEGKTLKLYANTNEVDVDGVINYLDYTIPIVDDRIALKAEDIVRFFPKWRVGIDGLSVYYTTKGGIFVRKTNWIPIPIKDFDNTIDIT